jgi:glycosyltransferase involved in cell wall biosynthesis
MDRKPLISVIVTCYNYGKYIQECLNSVFNQTYKNIEIIIINDGSTDDSNKIINQFIKLHLKEIKIEYINQTNHGIVFARNKGICRSRGEYIIFLDADDFLDRNYIKLLLQTAITNEADIVYCDVKPNNAKKVLNKFPEYDLARMENGNIISVCSLIRKKFIGNTRFDSFLNRRSLEDWDFFLALCMKGAKAVKDKKALLNYRIHEDSRNNKFITFDNKRDFVEIYIHVINKYKSLSYLSGYTYSHWYLQLFNSYSQLAKSLAVEIDRTSELSKRVSSIYSSREFRVGNAFLHPTLVINFFKKHVGRYIHDTTQYNLAKIGLKKKINYFINDELHVNKKSNTAVIIHLYYTETWSLFESYLKNIPDSDFDIFITMPEQNRFFIKQIKNIFPDAYVYIVPNKGRDVLPFLMVARELYGLGYEIVLKLHSKKSTHREDGQIWLNNMVKALLPSEEKVKEIINVLDTADAAIVGPQGYYYPLSVNYSSNRANVRRALKLLNASSWSEKKLSNTSIINNYGFYGGTMEWIKLSTVKELLDFSPSFFENENGQIDGTFAHAFERMLCLVPELEHKKIYSSGIDGIKERSYHSDNIPVWAKKN